VTGRPRLLLVDDEVALLAELAPFFRRAGFEVASARAGSEDLKLAASFKPDSIVLDVLMPGPTAGRSCAASGPAAAGSPSSCSPGWGAPPSGP
jgi:DNA-binding response OmpR family regulator